MVMEITTLGLRNLQSTLGIHKTFIEFELPNGKRCVYVCGCAFVPK